MIQPRFLGLFGGQDQRPRPRQESNRKWLMKGSNWSITKEIILVSCFWKWYLDHLHLSVFDPGHKLFRRLKWLYMAGYMSEALPISFHININPIFCQSWPYNQKLNCEIVALFCMITCQGEWTLDTAWMQATIYKVVLLNWKILILKKCQLFRLGWPDVSI